MTPRQRTGKSVRICPLLDKKGDLPCPLGEDYVNFVLADTWSYVLLNKVWIKEDAAAVLDKLKESQPLVVKARVFQIDRDRDPNLDALRIVPQ